MGYRAVTLTLLAGVFLGIILELHPTLGEGSELDDGSGSGSGLGGSGEEPELVCRVPANVPEIPSGNEGDMIRLIRCHVVCIEKVCKVDLY